MIIISCGKFSQLCHSKLCTPLRGGRQATQVFVAKMQVARNMNTEARITMGNNGKKTEKKKKLLDYWVGVSIQCNPTLHSNLSILCRKRLYSNREILNER